MFSVQNVGRKIVELRKKRNMTQTELADQMNVSFQAVSNWERGNSMPDISKLPELADIFGITVSELIGEDSKLIDAAMHNEIKEYLNNNKVSQEEIEEHIPILKPEQMETIVKNIDLSHYNDINVFLPFLDDETIELLAQKRIEKGESIDTFLPFLTNDEIVRFAGSKMEKGESINSFLPFMDEAILKQIVFQMMK